jgi:hypothetical protein
MRPTSTGKAGDGGPEMRGKWLLEIGFSVQGFVGSDLRNRKNNR